MEIKDNMSREISRGTNRPGKVSPNKDVMLLQKCIYCHPFVFMPHNITLTSCYYAFILGLINVLSACQADIYLLL